jgi:hypothetical protein
MPNCIVDWHRYHRTHVEKGADVNSSELPSERAERLRDRVQRQLWWLDAFCKQLERLGIPPTDPMHVAAINARDRMNNLLATFNNTQAPRDVAGSDAD